MFYRENALCECSRSSPGDDALHATVEMDILQEACSANAYVSFSDVCASVVLGHHSFLFGSGMPETCFIDVECNFPSTISIEREIWGKR